MSDKQGHKDRLNPVDASFLHREGRASHMHVGALATFDGPPPAREDFTAHVESRLQLVPRFRQKLAVPRFEAGRPFWIDDPRFNIGYHVRHTALPSPGTDAELRQLLGRIFSQRLDRSKPLWELWLVQGLASDGFALISKTHHALVDGISGVDLSTVLLDLGPVPAEIEEEAGWTPAREPSQAELIAEGVKGLIRTPGDLAGRALGTVRRPRRTASQAVEALEGIGEVAWAALNPAPEVPLNVEIGPHRRVWWLRRRLAELKEIKDTLGGTVNDVVLAVVAGGLGRWLRTRGVRTEGLELRALVPVSVRGEGEHGALGNRIAAMRGPLPVYARDPVERLRAVREAMSGLKESKQALGAEVIAGLERFAPPTLLAQASRLNFSTRLFNLLVTNIPGPQFPLYLLGRELQEIVPVAFLPDNHALAVAIMSYNGRVDFGLLADYDAMPDLETVAELIDESLDELLEAARDARERHERAVRSAARGEAASRRARRDAPAHGETGSRRARPEAPARDDASSGRAGPGAARGGRAATTDGRAASRNGGPSDGRPRRRAGRSGR